MLRLAVVLLSLAQALAFRVPASLAKAPLPAFKTPIAQHATKAAAAAAPLLTSLPALAVGEASDLDGLNGVLTAGVGICLLVIGYFAFEFTKEVGSQVEVRKERLGLNKPRGQRQAPRIIYDDVDYTYKANSRAVVNSRDRKKTSKQVGKDGKKFAPWMDIDEQRVDKVRAMRRENKRKTGSFFGR